MHHYQATHVKQPRPLPQEIIEKVIDCTTRGTSLRHLKELSLVCSAWLTRARFHLFRRLRVFISCVNPDALEDLLTLLQGSTVGRDEAMIKFPPATAYVQELFVSDPFRTKATPSENMPDGPQAYRLRDTAPLDTLIPILRMLTNLRVLELDMHISSNPFDCLGSIPSLNMRLHRIELSVDASSGVVLPLFESVTVFSFSVPINIIPSGGAELQPEHWPHNRYHQGSTTGRNARVKMGTLNLPARMLAPEYAEALRQLGAVAVIEDVRIEGRFSSVDDTRWKILDTFLERHGIEGGARGVASHNR